MSLIFATIPSKRLAQGITSSSSSFYVNNIIGFNTADSLNVDDTDLGTQHYVVFRNDTGTKIEIMEIDPTTISTGPITIVRRGLSYYGDRTTEVTANKLDWSANETIVNFGTDAPQLFQYLKEYIDAAAIAGSVPASTATPGIVERATQAEADAGTGTNGSYDLFVRADSIRGRNVNEYAVDSVGSDAYAITISPAITAYSAGQRFTFKAGTANTGSCTLNVSGLGAKTIKKHVSTDLDTGDILANQIVEVEYDGTNMQLLSRSNFTAPVVRTYTGTLSASKGSTDTQFDITEPVADTMRYTWDGTGTDPVINGTTCPIGAIVQIYGSNFTAANNGAFIITGSGSNYFEVTNASGVAENNVLLSSGNYFYVWTFTTSWSKPAGLKYIIAEVQAGGGAGQTVDNSAGSGGGGGGYSRKLIAATSLGSTEAIIVGVGGGNRGNGFSGYLSSFGVHLTASGGGATSTDNGGVGGIGASGDINIRGGGGAGGGAGATGSGSNNGMGSGSGGSAVLGGGGAGAGANDQNGGDGGSYGGGGAGSAGNSGGSPVGGRGGGGIVIVTEYYN